MSTESAARKAAERITALFNGDISHGKTIEAVIQSALGESAACQTIAPPPDYEALSQTLADACFYWREGTKFLECKHSAEVMQIVLKGYLGAAPAVSTLPDIVALILDIYRYRNLWDVPDITHGSVSLRALIKRHLGTGAVSTPRCPKCGSCKLNSNWVGDHEHKDLKVSCPCGFYHYISSHESFSQFFHPAPSSPR